MLNPTAMDNHSWLNRWPVLIRNWSGAVCAVVELVHKLMALHEVLAVR